MVMSSRPVRPALLVAVLYAAVLLVAGFEHHDLACELKTPQHCGACVSSAVSAVAAPATAAVSHLAEAGCAVLIDVRIETLLLDVDRTGRSPPSVTPIALHTQI